MRPRERILAIAVAVIAGGWFLDAVAVSPALEWLRGIERDAAAARREAGEAQVLVDRQARILGDWRGRHAAGLLDDEAAARYRLQQAIAAAARASGLAVDSVGGGQLVDPGRDQAFALVRLTVSGQGTLAQAQAFIAGLESAAQPLRIERCELAAADPKQDRLDLALTVSTRIVPAAARAGRQVPEGTAAWQPEARDASLDAAVLAARPFLADRSRPRAAVAAAPAGNEAPPPAAAGWALVGIVAREPGAVAFLRQLGGSDERLVRVGDSVGDAAVERIDAEGLHLAGGMVIAVGCDLAGQPAALPTARSAVRPAAPAAPSTAPSTVPATPAAGGDADRDAILQRLRQQRNRNQ